MLLFPIVHRDSQFQLVSPSGDVCRQWRCREAIHALAAATFATAEIFEVTVRAAARAAAKSAWAGRRGRQCHRLRLDGERDRLAVDLTDDAFGYCLTFRQDQVASDDCAG